MDSAYEQRLRAITDNGGSQLIAAGQRGLEKECLRITSAGLVARTPHPVVLGSTLTNRYITTDYSEALLEFVTPPESSAWASMQFLCDIHQFTYAGIGDELLWPFSMPCRLRGNDDVPVAQYGSSNVGQMKTIYRNGLGHRYGRFMQAIAGIHFNYSVPELYWQFRADQEGKSGDLAALKSADYMGAVRNVRRMDWLLLYLFGASPAVCRSFLAGMKHNLAELDTGTCYGEWATSLRMSDLGYHNSNQSALTVSANSLEEYVRDLSAAIATPHEPFMKLGIRRGSEYLQLNANQLQIENEFYSSVRPKRVARSGERPSGALRRAGVEYVELRALDLSPFDPAGIGQVEQKFLEAFLLYCVLADSPPIHPAEQSSLEQNHLDVARRGRQPGLELMHNDTPVLLTNWAREICTAMRPVCDLLDNGSATGYTEALEQQIRVIDMPALTPSARLLADLRDTQASFAEYGLAKANIYREYFRGLPDEFNSHRALLEREAAESVQRQKELEAADELSLDEFLARHYA